MKDIPAFPSTHPNLSYMGMTLRDYFAAKAMPLALEEFRMEVRQPPDRSLGDHCLPGVARRAYAIADAMLKAREA